MANRPPSDRDRSLLSVALLARVVVTIALVATGCATGSDHAVSPTSTSPDVTAPALGPPPAEGSTTAPSDSSTPSTPATTDPPPPTDSVPSTQPADADGAVCAWSSGPASTTPASLPDQSASDPGARQAVEAVVADGLADPRLSTHTVGVSFHVDGVGLVEHDADVLLLPASNQKLLTAAAALAHLPADFRFTTTVTTTVQPAGGMLGGDLVLVGGGSPTLASTGPESLDELARQVAATGITSVAGAVVIDDSRYELARAAPGWLDWQQPQFVGWLSALVVDQNRWQTGVDTADPALANGRRFVEALGRHGVSVAGGVRRGATSGGSLRAAEVHSGGLDVLTRLLLTDSNNMTAESIVREVGLATTGTGSHAAGTAAMTELLGSLCISPEGVAADGSGLSRNDLRSAGQWRALLQAVQAEPWWPTYREGLAVAGQTGTLSSRLGGGVTAGNVRAKTGQTIPARALSGVFTTAGGRAVTFSVVVNGDAPIDAEYAIDELVTAVASWTG